MKTNRASLLLSFVLVGWTAIGCQQDVGQRESHQANEPHFEIRDSGGVRIIQNTGPPEGSRLAWQIGPDPALSIGAREGEAPYLLNGAVSATKLPDGRIVVADGGSSELRMFDSVGTHVRTWGGDGEGPGEFWWLNHVAAWPGDSIVAWYPARGRVSVFGPDGSYGRSFGLWGDCPPGCPGAVAARRDGTILTTHPGEASDSALLQIRDGDGELLASLEKLPDRDLRFWKGERGETWSEPVPYGAELVKGLWGDLIIAGRTSRYEIRAFRANGALARIVRLEHPLRATTPDDYDRYIESELEEYSNFITRGRPGFPASELEYILSIRRETIEATTMAETFPVFSSFMADAADHLWVREYDFPGEARPAPLWTVFDPEGRVLGYVETPPGLRIFEIGADYILGRARDELGVESVLVWPLERSG
ncbi:MAG: hypothetical protein F4139_10585 [Gemmatimonadetes bacterium]|nr:hypothetical protein [Gemmatimonadota bacterium]MYK67652.1 hypothetical protein [Gemmatimonadota bacterium]